MVRALAAGPTDQERAVGRHQPHVGLRGPTVDGDDQVLGAVARHRPPPCPSPHGDVTFGLVGIKVAVVGGGSTYTPELVDSLCDHEDRMAVDELVLLDPDLERLEAVGGLAGRMLAATGLGRAPRHHR